MTSIGTFGNGTSGAAASTHDWNMGDWRSWPMMVAAFPVLAQTTATVIAALSNSAIRVHRLRIPPLIGRKVARLRLTPAESAAAPMIRTARDGL